jgi:hypothetical protein
MAKRKAKQRTRGKLNDTFTKIYDRMVAKQKLAARGRNADADAKASRDAIVMAMGEHEEATLTDGRVIRRVKQTRNLPPLPAKVIRWEQLKDISDLGLEA